MREDQPSATAWRVAMGRAAHQFFDDPRVFDDPLAMRIVGAYADGASPETFFRDRYKPTRRAPFLRAVLAVRSRLAEDELAAAVARGVRQYVVLGAGLDTFAYRNPHGGVRVFEVDRPATQTWKRNLLERAAIREPAGVTFVPLDFERQTAMDGLSAAGFDRSAPAFFAWLGVTMYLREDAVDAVLQAVASMPPSSGITFDYAQAGTPMNVLRRMAVAAVNRRLSRIGEPWITFFTPNALARKLEAFGFHDARDLGPDQLNASYFGGRTDGLHVRSLARLIIASV